MGGDMRIRKVGVAALASALALGGLVAGSVGVAAAKKPVLTATGHVTCTGGTGKGKVSPPFGLASAGSGPRVTTSKFKGGTCSGTTQDPTVTPISAKISATSTSPNSTTTCVDLQTPQETATVTQVDIKWKANGGKINPTHITFTTLQGGVPAMGFTSPGPSGTATVTGSYAGDDATSQVVVSDSVATLTAACLKKGIKKLNFGGGGSLVIAP
jgi:hypothetical protein